MRWPNVVDNTREYIFEVTLNRQFYLRQDSLGLRRRRLMWLTHYCVRLAGAPEVKEVNFNN